MPSRNLNRLALVALVSPLVAAAWAADWPRWRGPNHDGISPEKGLQMKWDAPPPKLWEAQIGSAFSAIICVGDKLYTCGTKDGKQVVLCLAADTGQTVWQVPLEDEYKEKQGGDGTRATPTFDDGRIYIQGALGKVACLDAATGKEVWSRTFDAKPKWGYSASVLIEGDLAIVQAGGSGGALAALNKKTGADVWKCAVEGPVGYATPYPFTLAGTRYVVGFLGNSVIIVEAASGKQVWSTAWKTDWDVNAATPIFHDGLLFLSSGYKTGSGLFRLSKAGETLKAEPLWAEQPDQVILGKFQSPVLHDGHLYVSDQRELKCVELLTGKEKWTERGIKDGTVLLADGHLLVLTEKGELQIAPVSPEKYAPLTKVEVLDKRCWTVPTLHNGRLYVRNLERAVCYELRARGT